MAPMHSPSVLSLHRIRLSRGHVALIVVAVVALATAVLLVALPDKAGPPPAGDGAAVGKLALEQHPYLGVSCPEPNVIDCGRVGFTVWLREPAARVDATLAGEPLRLHAKPEGGGRVFEGFLQKKGFVAGLGVRPDRPDGTWEGRNGMPAVPVRLTAVSEDGKRSAIELRTRLKPGYG